MPLTDARPTAASEGHVILSTPSTSPTRSTPRMYHVFLINMILVGQEDDSSGGGVTCTMQEMRTLLQASRKRPEPGSPRVRWDGRSLRNRMRSGMHEMRWKARQPRGGLPAISTYIRKLSEEVVSSADQDRQAILMEARLLDQACTLLLFITAGPSKSCARGGGGGGGRVLWDTTSRSLCVRV